MEFSRQIVTMIIFITTLYHLNNTYTSYMRRKTLQILLVITSYLLYSRLTLEIFKCILVHFRILSKLFIGAIIAYIAICVIPPIVMDCIAVFLVVILCLMSVMLYHI